MIQNSLTKVCTSNFLPISYPALRGLASNFCGEERAINHPSYAQGPAATYEPIYYTVFFAYCCYILGLYHVSSQDLKT